MENKENSIKKIHSDFKKDFAELLDKYHANFEIFVDGDTHGIFGESLVVNFVHNFANKNGFPEISEITIEPDDDIR